MVLKFDGHCPGALQRFKGDTLAEVELFELSRCWLLFQLGLPMGLKTLVLLLAKNPVGDV